MFNLKTFLFKKKTVCICGNCVTGVIPEFLNSYVTSILPGVEKALNFEITPDCARCAVLELITIWI